MHSSSGPTIARQLADFVVKLRFEDIGKDELDCAKALVLDQFACQLIGSTLPWTGPALQLVELSGGEKGESTVINRGSKFLAADTTFANATFGQACEMDDSAYGASGHIGSATIPAALAMGEREGIDGKAFLLSIVAGYEVMYRLMASMTPHNINRGFQSQGIGGPFASATVVGKILGLDAEQLTNALAIAGSHATGPAEYDQSGGEVKRIHAGLAARGGVNSALLAKFGLTGPPTIIEGKRGFCNIFAEKSDPDRITRGLGQTLNITNVSYKMYPTVGTIHTAIAAVERLVAENRIEPADMVRLRIAVPANVLLHGAGIVRPTDVVSAQFSLSFSAALAVEKKSNALPLYMDPGLWNDPAMTAAMDRMEIVDNPAATGPNRFASVATMTLRDGRTVEVTETHVKGSPVNPASPADRYAKVRGLAGAVLSPARIDRLIEAVERIEQYKRIADIVPLMLSDEAQASARA